MSGDGGADRTVVETGGQGTLDCVGRARGGGHHGLLQQSTHRRARCAVSVWLCGCVCA